MKYSLQLFFMLIASAVFGQDFYLNSGAIASTPLEQFCTENYSDGIGAQLGFSFEQKINNRWGVGVGINFILSGNGSNETELPIGDYTLSNRFTAGQFLVNGIYQVGNYSWYGGLHIGRANFYTSEFLSFAQTQDDGSTYYSEQLYKSRLFEYGGQLGLMVQLSPIWKLNVGASLIKSDEYAKYIDFDSFEYDGEDIFYDEPKSKPFLFTFSVGFKVNITRLQRYLDDFTGDDAVNNNDSFYAQPTSRTTCARRSRTSSTRSKTTTRSSSKKSNVQPKLHKRGKTPVKYE